MQVSQDPQNNPPQEKEWAVSEIEGKPHQTALKLTITQYNVDIFIEYYHQMMRHTWCEPNRLPRRDNREKEHDVAKRYYVAGMPRI